MKTRILLLVIVFSSSFLYSNSAKKNLKICKKDSVVNASVFFTENDHVLSLNDYMVKLSPKIDTIIYHIIQKKEHNIKILCYFKATDEDGKPLYKPIEYKILTPYKEYFVEVKDLNLYLELFEIKNKDGEVIDYFLGKNLSKLVFLNVEKVLIIEK